MEELLWQAECIKARATSLYTEIRRVRNKEHPYSEPQLIFDTFLKILENEINFLDETLTRYIKLGLKIAIRETLSRSRKNIFRIAQQFNYVDRIDSARIPFEILPSLSSVADHMLGEQKKHISIIRLDPRHAYEVRSAQEIFSKLFTGGAWEDTVKKANKNNIDPASVLLFGFPSEDAKKILHHALSAHEFGHIVATKSQIRKQIDIVIEESKRIIHPKYKEAIESRIVEISHETILNKGGSSKDVFSNFETAIRKGIASVVDRWVNEAFADLVGMRLLGPAYFAALDRMLITDVESNCDNHPPLVLRRSLCNHFFHHEKYKDLITDPIWKRVVNGNFHDPLIFQDVKYEMAQDITMHAVPKLIDIVNNFPSILDYGYEKLNELVERIEDHLFHLSPPSQEIEILGNNLDSNGFWMILYSAWHFRLNHNKYSKFLERYGWEAETDPEKGEEVLSNLIVHSLKSLELKSRYLLRMKKIK